MMGIVTCRTVNPLPDFRDQINRQEVHRVQQENPDKHGERQRRYQLATVGVVNDAFGLRVDHFHQHFDRGLKTTWHTRRCGFGSLPQEESAQNSHQDRPEDRIKVIDRKVDHAAHRLVLQMRQVVTDVFTCGGSVFSSHLFIRI